MWLLFPLAAAAGAGLYELLRSSPKTEVVQFTQNPKMIAVNETALRVAKVEYDVNTDGVNQWIMVKAKDRTAAVQAVLASARAAGLIQ